MFYDKQDETKKKSYKEMLKLIGSLSRLFSESDQPYLSYRSQENIFCRYFDAKNLARHDCSADAGVDHLGIGLKTWINQDKQKIAEFGRLRPQYADLEDYELVKRIAGYRNERIRFTMSTYDFDQMIYHVIKRRKNKMEIYEAAFDPIDIDSIQLLKARGTENSVYFTDGKHEYHFSKSKNTLYMDFKDMDLLDSFEVAIFDDPFEALQSIADPSLNKHLFNSPNQEEKPQLCLRLYTFKDHKKFVQEKSGLNQWNGYRTTYKHFDDGSKVATRKTPRNENELYIPYPAEDRKRMDFFPPRNTKFDLLLPTGRIIKAKVCQDGGKAIMSDPNSDLGYWLLRDVFNLQPGEVVTYEMLQQFGVDSVIFTKINDLTYTIDFAQLGTYEKMYGKDDPDDIYDNDTNEDE